MSAKAETSLARNCIKWVKAQGGDAWHVHGSAVQRSGEPDLDGCVPTKDGGFIHFKIELKTPGNLPRKLQAIRLERWSRFGYTTGVAESLSQFIEIVTSGKTLFPV